MSNGAFLWKNVGLKLKSLGIWPSKQALVKRARGSCASSIKWAGVWQNTKPELVSFLGVE